ICDHAIQSNDRKQECYGGVARFSSRTMIPPCFAQPTSWPCRKRLSAFHIDPVLGPARNESAIITVGAPGPQAEILKSAAFEVFLIFTFDDVNFIYFNYLNQIAANRFYLYADLS